MNQFIDWLTSIAENSSSPLLMVILLGIVFALDPCLMLTNIAAIGYIGKDVANPKSVFLKGLWYVLGRTISYGILGLVLLSLLIAGGNISPIQHFIHTWGNVIIIPLLIIIGLLLCFAQFLPFRINPTTKLNQEKFRGSVGAFLLGSVLSFAFCPTNALLFFGMMVPVCATSSVGYVLPFIFAFTTAIPVIFIAYIIAFSINSITKHFNRIKQVGKYIRYATGIMLILIGIILAIQEYSNIGHTDHHHHNHTEYVK